METGFYFTLLISIFSIAGYNKVTVLEDFTCLPTSSSSYLNATQAIIGSENSQFPSVLQKFTISMWVFGSKVAGSASQDLFSVFIPSQSKTFSFKLNFNPTSAIDLYFNNSLIFANWMTSVNPIGSFTSASGISSPLTEIWRFLAISFDTHGGKLSIYTNTNPILTFSLNDKFRLDSVLILLGCSTPISSSCIQQFVIKNLNLHDDFYNTLLAFSEIANNAPGSLYGLYKPMYSSQYDSAWYNLNSGNINGRSDIILSKPPRTFFLFNEGEANFQIGNYTFIATFPNFIPFSKIDQSYIFTISYEVFADGNQIIQNANICQNFQFFPYLRKSAASLVVLSYASLISSSSNCIVSWILTGTGVVWPSLTKSLTPSVKTVSIFQETLTIICQLFYLQQPGVITVISNIHGIRTNFGTSTLYPTDTHQIEQQSTANVLVYSIKIYEISIVLGNTFTHSINKSPSIVVPLSIPFYVSCKSTPNIKRTVSNDNSILILNSCTSEFAFQKNCAAISNCLYCKFNVCINCQPGYFWSNGTCLNCQNHYSPKGVWDHFTKRCFPGNSLSIQSMNSVQISAFFSNLNFDIILVGLNISCQFHSQYCFGRTNQLTVFLNKFSELSVAVSSYPLVPLSAYNNQFFQIFQNYAYSILTNSISVIYAGYNLGSLTSSTDNFPSRFRCSLLEKFNQYNSSTSTDSCQTCNDQNSMNWGIDCVQIVKNCLIFWIPSIYCLVCNSNYVLRSGICFLNTWTSIFTDSGNIGMFWEKRKVFLDSTNQKENLTLLEMNKSLGFLSPSPKLINIAFPQSFNCSSVDLACTRCHSSDCLECTAGFFLIFSKCFKKKCNVKNCLLCEEEHSCICCEVGFELIRDFCVKIQYPPIFLFSENIELTNCPNNCLTCNKNESCLICVPEFQIEFHTNLCIKSEIPKHSRKTIVVSPFFENLHVNLESDCINCQSCQSQNTFFCQKCVICRKQCSCYQTASNTFYGFNVICLNVVFDETFLANSLLGQSEYRLFVKNSNKNQLEVRLSKFSNSNISFALSSFFIKSSMNCTFIAPFNVNYYPTEGLDFMSESNQYLVAYILNLSKKIILFLFYFIEIGICEIILNVIQMNDVFLYICILKFPIFGYFQTVMNLWSFQLPFANDMSRFFNQQSQIMYYFLSYKFRAFRFLNQTTLLINSIAFLVCSLFFLISMVLDKIINKLGILAFPMRKILKFTKLVQNALFFSFTEGEILKTFPISIFLHAVSLKLQQSAEMLTFFIFIGLAFIPCAIKKIQSIRELILFSRKSKNSKRNNLKIFDLRIFWLKLNKTVDELLLAITLFLVFTFQYNQKVAVYILIGFCYVSALLSLILSNFHFKIVTFLRILQCFAIAGFARLCLTMLNGTAFFGETSFNFFFLSSHILNLLSSVVSTYLEICDRRNYIICLQESKAESKRKIIISQILMKNEKRSKLRFNLLAVKLKQKNRFDKT